MTPALVVADQFVIPARPVIPARHVIPALSRDPGLGIWDLAGGKLSRRANAWFPGQARDDKLVAQDGKLEARHGKLEARADKVGHDGRVELN